MASQPDTSLASSPKAKPPLFQVKKWNNLAFWAWSDGSDICAICRASVLDACMTCDTENRADSCVIVWGHCNHSFHNCCMDEWIKRNNRCPLCQQDWKSRVHHFIGRKDTRGSMPEEDGNRLSGIIDVGATLWNKCLHQSTRVEKNRYLPLETIWLNRASVRYLI